MVPQIGILVPDLDQLQIRTSADQLFERSAVRMIEDRNASLTPDRGHGSLQDRRAAFENESTFDRLVADSRRLKLTAPGAAPLNPASRRSGRECPRTGSLRWCGCPGVPDPPSCRTPRPGSPASRSSHGSAPDRVASPSYGPSGPGSRNPDAGRSRPPGPPAHLRRFEASGSAYSRGTTGPARPAATRRKSTSGQSERVRLIRPPPETRDPLSSAKASRSGATAERQVHPSRSYPPPR